ncbi:MAG: B12-binding domain-containing radical SAM protein, partial [Clostridiales bacterium]|nr:B12-binding domain-containing radical SAM protein [Clostridiales bacterium]
MKTLLIAVNSQFSHSNLAVWQLKACCTPDCGTVDVEEFHINQPVKQIYGSIVRREPDVAAFSCYIWNIRCVLELADMVRQALPDITIILGGPEVQEDYDALISESPGADYILPGEGEYALPALLRSLRARAPGAPRYRFTAQPPVPSRQGGSTRAGSAETPLQRVPADKGKGDFQTKIVPLQPKLPDLAALPSPYTQEMLDAVRNKMIYYESSRGCPYRCAYCLSQEAAPVRYKPLEQVKRDLLLLKSQGITLVKFTDRTFNADSARCTELWRFAAQRLEGMRLHFEIGADLLDEAQLEVLGRMPPGRVQLEAGVQSTNPQTLAAVRRKAEFARIAAASRALLERGNIHYHMDLIAGLPYEDYARFQQSFNDVYALRPHTLQLGFLKLLKGTPLRRGAADNGYRFRQTPPYEVLSSRWITAGELLRLDRVERVLARYYNSGRFALSLPLLEACFPSPYQLYDTFAGWLERRGALDSPCAAAVQFEQCYRFAAAL